MNKIRAGLLMAIVAIFAAGPRHAAGGPAAPPRVSPSLVATIELGGSSGDAMLGNMDGDGVPDAVTLSGGHVLVVSGTGRTLFDQFLGATEIVTVADVDGNGKDDVVYIDRNSRALGLLDVGAGIVRWRYVFPESVDLDPAYVRVADINSSLPGLETVVFPDYSHTLADANGYFLTSAGDVYARPTIKNVNGNQLNYPSIAIGNIDGIGDPEVVVVGRPKLLVYSSAGLPLRELEFRAGDPEGRHYGTVTLANVDSEPDLEAIVIADRISPEPAGKPQAITVFKLTPSIRELWRYVPPTGQTFESIPNSVADFDGDGAPDIVVNRFDGSTQVVEFYRGAGDPAQPGQPRLVGSLRDSYAWDALDMDGDGRLELLVSRSRQAKPSLSYQSKLSVYEASASRQTGLKLRQVGDEIVGARFATRPLRFLNRLDLLSSISAERPGVVMFDVLGTKTFATYTKTDKGVFQMQLRSLAPAGLRSREVAPRPGNVRAVGASGAMLVADGAGEEPSDVLGFYHWDATRNTLAETVSFRAPSFEATAPAVADLDGDGAPELVARRPGKRVSVYSVDQATGRTAELWQADGNAAPLAVAGRPRDARVFLVAPDRRDRAMLVAHAGDGSILWKTRFPDLPASTRPDVMLGSFTHAGTHDVWVSAPRAHSWMVRGTDGTVVWDSPDVYTFTNRAAVTDFDGDQTEDLVVVSNVTYGIYSGRDGRSLVGPVDVRTIGGDFFATPLLAGDGTMALAARANLARTHLTGKRVWTVTRPVQRTNTLLTPALAHDSQTGAFRLGGNYGDFDRFVAYNYDDGKVAFTTSLVPMTDTIAADTNGDGIDEFIFGTIDGRVVGLNTLTGVEEWSIDVAAFMGTPALAESPSGRLLCIPVSNGSIRVYRM